MDLVTPGIGLVFWTTLAFIIVLLLLKKLAWKPILETLKERETSIQEALDSAENAKLEMEKLSANIEDLKKDARLEREQMLKEAKDTKDKIVSEAKAKAKEEGDRLMASARESINNERMAAISDLKNQVAVLSIEIAEKILKENLADDAKQTELAQTLVKEVRLN